MDLLNKFMQVKVSADSRISEADKAYCDKQFFAYDAAIPALKYMAEHAQTFVSEQQTCLQGTTNEENLKYISQTYLGDYGFDSEKYLEHIMGAHQRYIGRIVSYFAEQYHVTLSEYKIKNALIPEKPEFSGDMYGWGHWTDEEKAAYKRKKEAYNKTVEEYNQSIYDLRISYSDILDHIFAQLEGFSFHDKAENEIKAAAHKAAWRYGKMSYELKKSVITFSYGCSWNTWYSGAHIELHDDMKAVVRALSHFEFGTFDLPRCYGLENLLRYSFDQPEFIMDFLEKIKSVKCFKNGRVDFRFQSEAYARQFAEEYLGVVA